MTIRAGDYVEITDRALEGVRGHVKYFTDFNYGVACTVIVEADDGQQWRVDTNSLALVEDGDGIATLAERTPDE